MRIQRLEGSQERSILTAVIVSTPVLAQLAPKYKHGMFGSQYSNLIMSWCVEHYSRYQNAPGPTIHQIFANWAETNPQQEVVESVGAFLSLMSYEYQQGEEIHVEYILDIASKMFNLNSIKTFQTELTLAVDQGNLVDAEALIKSWNKVDVAAEDSIAVFNTPAIFQAASEQHLKQKPMIYFPRNTALGEFIRETFEPDSFTAFLASEKRGKSHTLLDLTWRAIQQGRRVAYFGVGDMSRNQIMRRFMARIMRRPFKACRIKVPVGIERMESDKVAVPTFREFDYRLSLNWDHAYKCARKILTESKVPLDNLRMSVHPAGSITASGIRTALLDLQSRLGFSPDVVLIDYADVLGPDNPRDIERSQINKTWEMLRRISQEFHCALVTATQADTGSYEAPVLRRGNFSNDKRKNAHVTAMIGINMSDEEKELGLCRWNFVELREDDFVESKCVHLAGSLAFSHPAMFSCW